MSYWMDFGAWKERHRELVRKAERGAEERPLAVVLYGWARELGARERGQGDMRVGLAAGGLPEGGWLPAPRW